MASPEFLRLSPTTLVLRVHVPLGKVEADRTTWAQLARLGTWKGYQGDKEFTFTKRHFVDTLRNFERQENPVTLTYEHPAAEAYAMGNPIPAAGRIIEMKFDGEWLLGRIQFTERGAGLVKAGEYIYTSIVIKTDAVDRVTGEDIGSELQQVGLVNDPFIDGQQALTLRRVFGDQTMKIKLADIKAVQKVLGELPDDASDEAIVTLVNAELGRQAALAGDAVADPSAEPAPALSAEPDADAVALADPALDPAAAEPMAAAAEGIAARLGEILGTDEAGVMAFIEANAEGIAALAGEGGAEPSDASAALTRKLTAAEGLISAQVTRIEALEAAEQVRTDAAAATELTRVEGEAKGKVAELIRCGRATEAERASLEEVAVKDPAWFEKNAASRPASYKFNRMTATPKGAPQANAPEGAVDPSSLDKREMKLFRHYTKTNLYTPAECLTLARQVSN